MARALLEATALHKPPLQMRDVFYMRDARRSERRNMHALHGTTQDIDSVHTFLTAITQACSALFGYILMKSSTDRGTRVANEREISTMIGARYA